jgi:gliding motility-associated lipoprotein GldH
MNKHFILIAAISVLFAACGKSVVYDANKHIPDAKWIKDSVVAFEVGISDTASLHTLYINLRNNTAYPYCNLFLFIKTIAPSGIFVCDTVEYMLTDAYGRWQGKGFSKYIDNRLEYKSSVQFPVSGVYRVEIMQGMRMYALPDIVSVGLRVEYEQ